MALHQRCDLVAATIADGGWEAFERPMPRCFFNYLAESPGLVIDGGVNTGYYAFLACAASDLNFVLGFEPDATVRKFLWQNIFLNQLTDRISVSPLALSNRIGLAELYVPDLLRTGIRVSSRSAYRRSMPFCPRTFGKRNG
jgi:hypothetical protein